MTEIYKCTNGTNREPVDVVFENGQDELTLKKPCPGCKWRFLINFERKPEYDGIVNLNLLSKEKAIACLAYTDAKEVASRQQDKGGFFSWQHLSIRKYPYLNAVDCWVVTPRPE